MLHPSVGIVTASTSQPATAGGTARRFPIGAEVIDAARVHFRIWAPAARRISVVLEGGAGEPARETPLPSCGGGYFEGEVAARAGALYRFRLDGQDRLLPDPASRFQPQGPHGPSQIVDPSAYAWEDEKWAGLERRRQVLYEMHIGTFSRAGTWAAASEQLGELRRLGITALELMPVADFVGRFGWGYDGVDLFAPYHGYGTPDDFRRFVDAAHGFGLGVLLDVVYNHLGPDGNYLGHFAPAYFTRRYTNEWGDAINFDGPDAGPVREFFVTNAGYWIEEFHLDGFRIDATQQIFDASTPNILAVIGQEARRRAGRRQILLVGENEPNHSGLVRPVDAGGLGLDALWNDDFHHSAMVGLTSRNDAYYTDYYASPQEFISAVKWGYLYQGQHYKWQKKRRGTPSFDLPPEAFVHFIQNHDQIANSAKGERCHQLTSPGNYRAMTALLLLGPATPMLFQGQEFAASSPFFYFADHHEELISAVAEGRRQFLAQFRTLAQPETQRTLPRPNDPQTFERCRLDFAERERHREVYRMHKDLLDLRHNDSRFREQVPRSVDGAVLGPEAFVLRYFSPRGDDRLLVINFGRDLHLDPAPEPLLAPLVNCHWKILWSSEDAAYGGSGTAPLETEEENWRIPGKAAVAMRPEPNS